MRGPEGGGVFEWEDQQVVGNLSEGTSRWRNLSEVTSRWWGI